MKKLTIILMFVFVGLIYGQNDITFDRNIDMKGNNILNIGTLNGKDVDSMFTTPKSLNFAYPYPAQGDRVPIWNVDEEIIIDSVLYVLTTDPATPDNVGLNFEHSLDVNSASPSKLYTSTITVSDTTTGKWYQPTGDNTLAKNEWVILKIESKTGTVKSLSGKIFYRGQ